MFNLENTQTLAHRRNVYVNLLFKTLVEQAARDLESELETEEVIVTSVAKIVAASVPNTGEGHAKNIREQVAEKIAEARESVDLSDTEAA